MRRFFTLLFLLCCSTMGMAKQLEVPVGNETVVIDVQHHGTGKAFVHLHQNEKTALKAARTVVEQDGGSILTLKHKGGRNIVFTLHGTRYEFDPNRIFTDAGIKKTLTTFGPYSAEAHQHVKALADAIIASLPEGKVIAVHNNASYSLKNYLPGHDLAHDAELLHQDMSQHFRNFYLVTRRDDFIRLKALRFNSILQAMHASDDGSLSVYLAGKPYINVEAGFDQLAQQISMLKHA